MKRVHISPTYRQITQRNQKPNNISEFFLLSSEKQKERHWPIRVLSKQIDELRYESVDCNIFSIYSFFKLIRAKQ